MLEYLKYLHEIYKERTSKTERLSFIRSIILTEAKYNNDLIQVILRSKPNKMAEQSPQIFGKLEATSYDFISTIELSVKDVFDKNRDASKTQMLEMAKIKNRFADYLNRPQAELYDFYIRKVKLLKSLQEGKALMTANVSLSARSQNINFATRALIQQMK
jgi:hypothetical protein